MTQTDVKLQDLVGKHWLDAVDFDSTSVESWGGSFNDCSVMRFRLDGVVYTAVEDPEDGYRSCMGNLVSDPKATINNVFEPVLVVGRMGNGRFKEVLELIDVETGGTVLEVGTEDTDDYYPCFVAKFTPKNMAINAGRGAQDE